MKITKAHADFWTSKRAPTFLAEKVTVDINSLIPTPKRTSSELETSNTCAIVIMARKRRDLITIFTEIEVGTYNSKKRRALVRKWKKRILFERLKRSVNTLT